VASADRLGRFLVILAFPFGIIRKGVIECVCPDPKDATARM
jgi:hypothetical protein